MTDPVVPPAAPVPPAAAPVATGPRTNVLAIVGLILAFVVSVAGIIVSAIALRQIKQTGEAGHGLAVAGVIVGIVVTLLYIIIIIVNVIIAATYATAVGGLTGY